MSTTMNVRSIYIQCDPVELDENPDYETFVTNIRAASAVCFKGTAARAFGGACVEYITISSAANDVTVMSAITTLQSSTVTNTVQTYMVAQEWTGS